MEWTPEEIRRRRDAKGLSQQDLAEELGVSRRAITNWEAGDAEPRGKNIRALDRVLGDTPRADEPTLSQATVLELLAELAGRYAALEGSNRRGEPPAHTGNPVRVKWRTEDAPAAEPETDEWSQTAGGAGVNQDEAR